MKLRNKLIPLLSVVATTTVVAPMISSCGRLSSMEMVDITKNYIPTIAKAKEQPKGLTDIEAADLYFEDVAKNPDVIAQDIIKYEADRLPQRINAMEYGTSLTQQWISTGTKAEVGVSDVSARKVTGIIEGKEVFFYALSAKIKYVTQFKLLSKDGTVEEIYDQTFSMTLKDIPTEVYPLLVTKDGKQVKRWYISNVFVKNYEPHPYLTCVPGWSYSFEETHTDTKNTRDEFGAVISKSSSSSDYGEFNRIDQISNLIDAMKSQTTNFVATKYLEYESYHLSDVGSYVEASGMSLNTDTDGYITGTYNKNCTTDGLVISDLNVVKLSSKLATAMKKADYAKVGLADLSVPEYDPDNLDTFYKEGRGASLVSGSWSSKYPTLFGDYFDASNEGDYTWVSNQNEDNIGSNLQMYSKHDPSYWNGTYFGTSFKEFDIDDNNVITTPAKNYTLAAKYDIVTTIGSEDDEQTDLVNNFVADGKTLIKEYEGNYPTLEFNLYSDPTTTPIYLWYAYIDKDSGELVQGYEKISDAVKIKLTPSA